MSRFEEKAETIYVGYDPNELNNYIADTSNCSVYNAFNKEFNPDIVPVFKKGDKITPSSPFYGPNGLSLQLDIGGNLFLHDSSSNVNIWNIGCKNDIMKLNEKWKCDGNTIVDAHGKHIVNSYCQFDTDGSFNCYGCTIASGMPIPYMSLQNTNNQNPKLIINGSYNGIIDTNKILKKIDLGNILYGNISIIDDEKIFFTNTLKSYSNDSFTKEDSKYYIDNAEKCANKDAVQGLIKQHDNHIAANDMLDDHIIAYDIQYLNAINLTVGIFITIGYIYFLYKKK
jgi:hypothetical protein